MTRSRGLTESSLCKNIGIDQKTWERLKRGIRRPSENLINELMIHLGDEIQLLFKGIYIEDQKPIFLTADKFFQDKITTQIQQDIKKIKKANKKLRY